MKTALEALPLLERQVLDLRWGLTGEESGLPEIAAALGLPASKARRLEARTIVMLRKPMRMRQTFRDQPAREGWKR